MKKNIGVELGAENLYHAIDEGREGAGRELRGAELQHVAGGYSLYYSLMGYEGAENFESPYYSFDYFWS
jgi:hypothetical protein